MFTDEEKCAANRLNQILHEPGYGGGQFGKLTIVRVLGGIQISREFGEAIRSMIAKLNVKD